MLDLTYYEVGNSLITARRLDEARSATISTISAGSAEHRPPTPDLGRGRGERATAEREERQSSVYTRAQVVAKLRPDRVALAAVIAGAAVRLVWGVVAHPPYELVFSDMQGYVERATRLADGGDLQRLDAFFPPGTHLLLAVPLELFGTGEAGLRAAAVEWWLLASAVPVLT